MYGVVCGCELSAPRMSIGKEIKCVCQIGEPAGDDGLECLSQSVEESNGPVRLGLGIVLIRLPKNDGDTFSEMRRTIT